MSQNYDIQISEDAPFQRREWLVERLGWAVMAVILLLAVLGFLGSGLLSQTTVVSEGGRLRLTYDRIARGKTSFQIEADIVPTSESPNEVQLWIDGRIVRTMLIDNITPEPSSVSVADGGYLYTFTTQAPGEPATVVFYATAQERGLIRGRAGTMPGGSVDLWQVVLP